MNRKHVGKQTCHKESSCETNASNAKVKSSASDNEKCANCEFYKQCFIRQPISDKREDGSKRVKHHRHAVVEHLLFDDLEDGEKVFLPVKIDDVVEMLDKKGENHKDGYYLYTTLGAMKSIFTNHKIHLTRASEMNDQLEPLKCDRDKWNSIFMACFAYGGTESMGMWSMYGGSPDESVRICFPQAFLKRRLAGWRDNLQTSLFKAERQSDGSFNYSLLPNISGHLSLHDVIYRQNSRNGFGSIHWHGRYAGQGRVAAFQKPTVCHKLTSYLKDAPWEYEREVRLVLELENPIALDLGALTSEADNEKIKVLLGPCDSKETQARDIISGLKMTESVEVKASDLKVRFK